MITKLRKQLVCTKCLSDHAGEYQSNLICHERENTVICGDCGTKLGKEYGMDRELILPIGIAEVLTELVQRCAFRIQSFESKDSEGLIASITLRNRFDDNLLCEVDWQPGEDRMEPIELPKSATHVPTMFNATMTMLSRPRSGFAAIHSSFGTLWSCVRFRAFPLLRTEPNQLMGVVRVQLSCHAPRA